jgi:hypothetical protein
MAKVRRIGRIWLVATAVSLSAAMVQPAAGAPTVKGDAAAWAEVETALKKAQGVAHREKTTTSGGSTTIVEFVPPDSRHFIEQHPGGRSEGFAVGDKTWMPVGDKWQCVSAGIPQGPLPKFEGPLPKVEYEITVMRGQDLVIEGTPTRSYNSTSTQKFQGQSITDKTRFYIGITTGLPRRIVFEKDSGYTTTIDYYDYGAKISITPPPCSN